ncbi:Putative deoxyribonuclease TATDN1 [Papilio machaon]|uniref:Deoxyribonuclease TATDN1 n=1 Tax=Papilio machaon TaxID=76193 RepID=A0A194QVN2_PAPMA|nr:Putative deoxyribonuclease TATDN1 [Papilio machaon]
MRRMASIRKYIDIGANLTDEMYQGVYHASKKHEPDLDRVLERSWANGMYKMIITGGSSIDSKKAIDLSYTDLDILKQNKDDIVGGVVHSFDGPQDSLEKILELGMYIGINGCSLRTKENLEVVRKIPQDRLMIETDCPWCEVKPTHPGYTHVVTKFPAVKKEKYSIDSGNQVKGRNEPVNIVQVLEILAAVRKENIDELAEAIFNNTNKLFFNNK